MKRLDWKSFWAGSVSTVLVMGLGVTAFAASNGGKVSFNTVNLETGSSTVARANDSYRLQNGQYVPYSITYTDASGGGTVYLPIRKISEFTNTGIEWDGASNKVIINANTSSAYQNMTKTYDDGYQDGYNAGLRGNSSSGNYDKGYDDGYDDGYADGQRNNTSGGNYTTGYNDGYNVGYSLGYAKGKAEGGGTGITDRYQEGYDAGFAAGKAQGVTEGEKTGYDKGLAAGEASGYQKGYEAGYAAGKGDEDTEPGEKPTEYNYYSEFPTVPDFGDVTGARSSYPSKNTLENGVAYDYDLIDYQEALDKYAQVLKDCGFIQTNATEENYGITYIYRRGDVYVHIGVKASMMTNGIGIPTYPDSKFSKLAQAVQKAKQDVIAANTERPIYDVGSGQWIPDQAAIQKANEALAAAQAEYDSYLNKAINTYSVVVEKG